MTVPSGHPRALAPATLFFTVALSVAGAIIGLEILTTLGITPNTSLVGVLVAIAVSRLPFGTAAGFRSIHVQNLVQTNVSSATFAAANSLLLPIGVPVLVGRPDLVPAMLAGAALGMFIDFLMLYWLFDSRLFAAPAPWPHGLAAAEAILAGDRGGRRAAVLGLGAAAGVVGSSGAFGLAPVVPMSAFGVAFIGNAWALGMFGLGLLVSAYAPSLIGLDLNARYIPHGIMIGAGMAALGQALAMVAGVGRAGGGDNRRTGFRPGHAVTRTDRDLGRALGAGFGLYVAAGAIVAAAAGLTAEMSGLLLAGWVLYAAVACLAAELIVGLSAMHAGWFPAFATALIFLVLGLAAGFPPAATAILVGFVASGGPAFADAGYDLKAGWQLRGHGSDPAFELDGRRQQMVAGAVGLVVALVMVALLHDRYFGRGLFPPIDRVYAATIAAGIDRAIVADLLVWAIPGVVIQWLGGSSRQMGILFATGLLVANLNAGWAVLAGLALRLGLSRRDAAGDAPLTVFGAGCIAGDALWSFGSSVVQARWNLPPVGQAPGGAARGSGRT